MTSAFPEKNNILSPISSKTKLSELRLSVLNSQWCILTVNNYVSFTSYNEF